MLGQRKYEDIFGHLVPYIRIKDYILKRDEILKFTLESKNFLPTITLHISTSTKSLSRENMPVDGDRISVGIREDLATFKPISSDFIITSITDSPQKDNSQVKRSYYEYYITGTLFIPNLDSGLVNFTYTGLAEDALKEICIRIGLGYVHTKNVKTLRTQSWHCYDNPIEFIKEVTSHMWLGKDSFFDSWIDARRNLTVVNVNDLLGRKLADDGELDFTKYKNVNGSIGEDGKYVSNDLMDLKDTKFPKMICNDPQFEGSMWYPISYQYVNNSTNVSKAIGPQRNFEVYIQNNGVGQSLNDARHTIEIGVWYMREKLDLGYVIANGPTNYSKDFKMADNGNWRDENVKTFAPILAPIESDSDEETKKNDKSNLSTSGNISKEYIIAPEHNKINLAELDKQEVIVTTYGANLGILKGEKVPCFLYNRSNEKYVSETRSTQDNGFEFDMVCSGWFYVKGVELIYQPDFNPNNFITDWKTNITLTRREWFPPESTSTKKEAQEYGTLPIDVANGKSVESISSPSDDPSSSKTPANTDIKTKSIDNGNKNNSILNVIDNVTNELGGMYNEINDNIDGFKNTIGANSILNGISSIKDAADSEKEIIIALKDTINGIVDQGIDASISNISNILEKPSNALSILENTNIGIDKKLSSLENNIVSKAENSIKSGVPLAEDLINSSKGSLTNITSGVSSLVSSIEGSVKNLSSVLKNKDLSPINGIKDSISNLGNILSDKIPNVKNSIESAKASISNIVSNMQDNSKGETSIESFVVDSSIGGSTDTSFEDAMAYDSNGLKHFMNEFISVMNSESIPYTLKGTRRWALDKDDNKIYGNAFVMRETSEIYKTLDSDGNMYWLSDYSSRHYYGEAIDIEPTSSFDDLLEKICLSKKTLDCMYKYGICIQLEVSKSGHSKGTHFHCSTDQEGSQSKWWGIVNKRRMSDSLNTYVTILKRDYYEKETPNEVVVV